MLFWYYFHCISDVTTLIPPTPNICLLGILIEPSKLRRSRFILNTSEAGNVHSVDDYYLWVLGSSKPVPVQLVSVSSYLKHCL